MPSKTSPPSSPSSPSTWRPYLGLAFVSGAVGTVIIIHELASAGRLAPRYGSGMDVWATILATTLFSLAAGYFAGGFRVAKRATPRAFRLLLACCALLLWVATKALPEAEVLSDSTLIRDAAFLLGPSCFGLAMVSPWLVQMTAKIGQSAGSAAGWLYGISTLGGVAGALFAGFEGIPNWGLVACTEACAITLVVTLGVFSLCFYGLKWPAHQGAQGQKRRQARVAEAALTFLVIACAWQAWHDSQDTQDSSIIDTRDSWYGHYEVREDETSRFLLVNGILQTSAPRYASPFFEAGELLNAGNALELIPYLRPRTEAARRALLIGLGGGSLVPQLEGHGWKVDCVELDPTMLDLAREYFDFKGNCQLADGRRFLSSQNQTWDSIIVDVYRGEHLPSHMTTLEFFELVRRRLSPDGLLAINIIGAPAAPDVVAVLNTAKQVFGHCALQGPSDPNRISPMTAFASNQVILQESTQDRLQSDGLQVDAFIPWPKLDADSDPRIEILRDDLNNVALLREGTARAWRALSLKRYETSN